LVAPKIFQYCLRSRPSVLSYDTFDLCNKIIRESPEASLAKRKWASSRSHELEISDAIHIETEKCINRELAMSKHKSISLQSGTWRKRLRGFREPRRNEQHKRISMNRAINNKKLVFWQYKIATLPRMTSIRSATVQQWQETKTVFLIFKIDFGFPSGA
jgi:hypothetical protein